VEKGYTQGAILSLLNSFEAEAADNAHDSTYDPQARTITSMFAGDDDNQWLDQVEEEFGSDLSDHDEDDGNGNATKTTFVLDQDAKESLAKEMKEKDYDLEGVDSRSSKRTHRTDMTGRTGATSACSVTTKKYAMNFKQQKTDLNAERKKMPCWNRNSERWRQRWQLEEYPLLQRKHVRSQQPTVQLLPVLRRRLSPSQPPP